MKKFLKIAVFVELTDEEAKDKLNTEGKLDEVAAAVLDNPKVRKGKTDWIVEEVLEGKSLMEVVERFI